ncbi:MAG: hypothetical protein EOP49_28395 [Sphingobacteriales bacterium]|nr:MAG: hypothetical protein EOP49_28395 [Sphingobacteriales bacterium]
MRRKLSVFLVLLLIFITESDGWSQQIRFTDPTNVWRTARQMAPDYVFYWTWQDYLVKDSLYEKDGHQYTIISRNGSGGPTVLYVREDSAARKTYVILADPDDYGQRVTDTGEFLYMDFNLELGDTLIMPVVLSGNDNDSFSVHVVQEVDSQQIGSLWYKRMTMQVISGMGPYYNDYTVTEGIGSGTGPVIEPRYNGNEWGPHRLFCFSNQGIIPSPPFGQNCFRPLAIHEAPTEDRFFTVYPNPAND